MSIFQLATVLIYVTSVLTSPVNQALNNNQNPIHPALDSLFGSPPISPKNLTQSTDTVVIGNDSNTPLRSRATEGVPTEGGGSVGLDVKMEPKSSTDFLNTDKSFLGKKLSEIIEDELPKKSLSHPRKDAIPTVKSKVTARKGVGDPHDLPTTSTTVEPEVEIPDKEVPSPVKSSTQLPVVVTESNSPVIKNTEDKITEDIKKTINLEKKEGLNSTKTHPLVLVIPSPPIANTTTKHKPTYTTGEGDDDGKGMPSSPDQKEIGMPRKVDYIIPLVITIMATPVLGIAAFILYTRGRDCWDKRHYRRMDFLVEGMYND